MTRARFFRSALVVLALVAGAFVAGPADAYGPPLSPACANLHQSASESFTTTSEIDLADAMYNDGEEFLADATTEPGVLHGVVAHNRTTGNFFFTGGPGKPDTYLIPPFPGPTSFRLITSHPGTSATWHVDCGYAPIAEINSDLPYGGTVSVGQDVHSSVRCAATSNPIAHCVINGVDHTDQCSNACPAPIDTSTPGVRTLTVTATDTAGFSTTTSATYTVKQTQQITDVTITPALGSGSNTSQLYFVSAKSTSGLPVAVTVDPASADVCSASASTQDPTWVQAMAPGNCIVHLNQAGNDTYFAAPQVTQTIVINKDVATLIPAPATKGVLGLTPTKFAAQLFFAHGFGVPLVGETVTFAVAGKVLCSGVVGNDGYARCSAAVGFVNAFKENTYTASFAGNKYFEPATATGALRP